MIARDRVDDLMIAAFDQNIGHVFGDRFPLRDREQMGLALDAGIDHQRIVVEPFRVPQHRTGDFDRIVKGELMDDLDRRVVDRRQTLRELGARGKLDLVGETIDHLAERRNILFAIATGNQKIGRVPERPRAAFRRPSRDGLLQVPKH